MIPLARQATERAVFLDSTLALARIARSVIWLLYDRDPAKAAAEIDRAIALDPSLPDGYDWQAHRLLAVGQTDSAIATARQAVESSPFDATLRAHLGWQYLLARQDSLAAVTFARARALDSARRGHRRAHGMADETARRFRLGVRLARRRGQGALRLGARAGGRRGGGRTDERGDCRALEGGDGTDAVGDVRPARSETRGVARESPVRDVAHPTSPDYNPHPNATPKSDSR